MRRSIPSNQRACRCMIMLVAIREPSKDAVTLVRIMK
jgi:hypothetical protein